MNGNRFLLIWLVVLVLAIGATVPVTAAFKIYGDYGIDVKWTPVELIRPTHRLRLFTDVWGGPFFTKVKLMDAELLLDHQFQFLDGGKLGGNLQPVLEEIRFRWSDWFYTGAPKMISLLGIESLSGGIQ